LDKIPDQPEPQKISAPCQAKEKEKETYRPQRVAKELEQAKVIMKK
jgi:hypothetical protein